jgi:hypothetical protein
MTRRYVRLTFFAGLLLALGAAVYQIAGLERTLVQIEARSDSSARAAAGALDALQDIRASERAFLAEDQGAPYWHARLNAAVDRLKADMATLGPRVEAAATHGLFDTTDEALSRLLRIEARIGDHADAGRKPHAEDLIFADALEASASVERDVREAAAALAVEGRNQVRELRERELIVAALAATVSVLVSLLLLPAGRRATADATLAAESRVEHDLPLNLRDTTPRPAPPPTPPTVAPVPTPVAVARPTTADRVAAARLASAADLCVALARVQHSRDLPALLAHIARVLEAQGAIVWMADPARRELTPALSHGYGDAALARLAVIPWDAHNPAAEAFRRRDARVVNARNGAAGAVIAPLVSTGGCVGVITVELLASEPDATTVALARIMAAQLAGLIAPAAPMADEAPAAEAAHAASTTV